MSLNRRQFLGLGALSIGGILLAPNGAWASTSEEVGDSSAVAMLYDTTLCVGCRACQNACRAWNNTADEADPTGLYDAPRELSADTFTVIQLYTGRHETSFVKQNCMHCLEPACARVCPVTALQKMPEGPVVYDGNRCIGCRYCMVACPYHVPRYEWESPLPFIRKCTFCADRLALGMEPACTESCPVGAVIFGGRRELIDLAHHRILDNPGRYIDHVYGEFEGGGTSQLVLSHVDFHKLGLPTLGTRANTANSDTAVNVSPGVLLSAATILAGGYLLTKDRTSSEDQPSGTENSRED